MIATKCSGCGAITVESGEGTWSMRPKDFKKNFPSLKLQKNQFGCCDYCVNGWGIDLCGCGSGKKFGKCHDGHRSCNHPMQSLGERQRVKLWNMS